MRIPVDGRSTRRMSRVQIPSAPPLNTAYPDRILCSFSAFELDKQRVFSAC